jgi:hypothetical protein
VSGWSLAAVVLWLVISVASLWVWFPNRRVGRPPLERTWVLIAVVVALGVLTGLVALFAALGPPTGPPWSWLSVGVGAVAALLSGGAVTYCVLALADRSARPGVVRAQQTVLRGGAWIGALERLGMLAVVLTGWPEGVAAIVAVKAFARYPELKAGQASGATERFIIGTFVSLGWAAACAGIVLVLT